MNEIVPYLKSHGERPNTEIAEAAGISLTKVRLLLSELAAKNEVMACHSIWKYGDSFHERR
ncbi:hypothetical protein NTGHW29_430012 [Candidatus Nitrotoga sp. HW29]|nr:hypothetical protein NTGHW29_430012 [Candidatus Nitrotoga sp. HW29]